MTRRTRVKFCGMTHADDVAAACALGVDALGLIFTPRSTRFVTAGQARDLAIKVPPLVWRVGLFVDPDAEFVRQVLEHVALDSLQFHGSEPAAFCAQFGLPYFKAIPMGGGADSAAEAGMRAHPAARGFVFDAHAQTGSGGGGITFDWSRIPATAVAPVLAGGLTPDNVFDAISLVRPWAVDVASGIESSPGRKDRARMRRFIEEVTRADNAHDGH